MDEQIPKPGTIVVKSDGRKVRIVNLDGDSDYRADMAEAREKARKASMPRHTIDPDANA